MTELAPANSNLHYNKPCSTLMRSRFKSTCYRAANWIRAGQARGRTRNDRAHRIETTIKDVYVYPLAKEFKGSATPPARSRTDRLAALSIKSKSGIPVAAKAKSFAVK